MGRHHPPSPWRLPNRAWRWLGLSASGVLTVAALTQLVDVRPIPDPPAARPLLASAPTVPLPMAVMSPMETTEPPAPTTTQPRPSPAVQAPAQTVHTTQAAPPPPAIEPEPQEAAQPLVVAEPTTEPEPPPETTTEPPPPPSPSPGLGAQVVSNAREFLGVPYLYGGESASGMDCSGLVFNVLRGLGLDPPRVAADQATWSQTVPVSEADARAGDLVFYDRPASHVGIYAGDGQMVASSRAGTLVSVRPVYRGAYYRRITS